MMNMQSRNQYLKEVRTEYLKTKSKKERGELLNEAEKRTKLNRKYLLEKLRSKSNLDKILQHRKKRASYYDNSVKPALVVMWRIFDYPCGQRLEPSLKNETEKLRKLGELSCSNEVAKKLKKMSSATIDRKLKHQKEIEIINDKYRKKQNPLLYQKISVKVFSEQDRSVSGNMQIDLVEHCGASAMGQFVCTLDATDINSGWTEQEAVWGKGQENTKDGLDNERKRCPFNWVEIHSDGGTEFINAHLYAYSVKTNLDFSRSRSYKKNDNCLVEQKNYTHVRRLVGYLRYDTIEEMNLLNDLYRNEQRLFKNFFQPVIKLISKERVGGKIHRRYDKPKTPYQRIMESGEVSNKKKEELEKIYLSLNPAELKRQIDKKLSELYKIYQKKINSQKVDQKKKISVRFSKVRREPISVR
jgi:hypothetical protein